MSALAISGLDVTLDGAAILRDVTLRAEPGTWLGVIGPNGAGKSTLLHAVCGVVPYRGSISFGGESIATLDRRTRARHVALVSQSPTVPIGITVVDYVLLGRTPHRTALSSPSRTDRQVVRTVVDQLDLGRFAKRRLTTLSGGERQRVFLARALAQQSAIVLLDEPTAALDIGHQTEVLDLIDQLRHDLGLTIVTTLHDLTLAGRYPDTLAMLAGGRMVAQGNPHDVLTPTLIEQHYGAPVRVLQDNGDIIIVASRKSGAA